MTEQNTNQNCELHGPYVSHMVQPQTTVTGFQFGPFFSECPSCSEDRRTREAESLRKARERALTDAIVEAGIPPRFRGAELTGKSPPLAILRAYSKDFATHRRAGTGLVLIGPCGTGKTHAACAVLLELLRAGARCAYVTAEGLGREMRNTFQRGAENTEAQIFDYFSGVQLLVIDEIGASSTTHTSALVPEILGARYERQLPTILASNLSRPELETYLGQRAADRIAETCRWLPMTGPSRRRKTAPAANDAPTP